LTKITKRNKHKLIRLSSKRFYFPLILGKRKRASCEKTEKDVIPLKEKLFSFY